MEKSVLIIENDIASIRFADTTIQLKCARPSDKTPIVGKYQAFELTATKKQVEITQYNDNTHGESIHVWTFDWKDKTRLLKHKKRGASSTLAFVFLLGVIIAVIFFAFASFLDLIIQNEGCDVIDGCTFSQWKEIYMSANIPFTLFGLQHFITLPDPIDICKPQEKTPTPDFSKSVSYLLPGDKLFRGDELTNGKFSLRVTFDGYLMHNQKELARGSRIGSYLIFQKDGNVVFYAEDKKPYWASNTNDQPIARVELDAQTGDISYIQKMMQKLERGECMWYNQYLQSDSEQTYLGFSQTHDKYFIKYGTSYDENKPVTPVKTTHPNLCISSNGEVILDGGKDNKKTLLSGGVNCIDLDTDVKFFRAHYEHTVLKLPIAIFMQD